MSKAMTWHRPEYRGREVELIDLVSAAEIAGVGRSAVSNWRQRHADFPAVVATLPAVGRGPSRHLIVRCEFEDWHAAHRARPRPTGPRGPSRRARPRAEIIAARIAVLQRHVDRDRARLTELEAAAGRIRADLVQHVEALAAECASLTREIDAADRVRGITQ